jgi:hypothetical protein
VICWDSLYAKIKDPALNKSRCSSFPGEETRKRLMAELELPNLEEIKEIKTKTLTRRIALTTAILAVLLVITPLGVNNAMKEMLLTQQHA